MSEKINPQLWHQPIEGYPAFAERKPELVPKMDGNYLMHDGKVFWWGAACVMGRDVYNQEASWAWEQSVNAWAREIRGNAKIQWQTVDASIRAMEHLIYLCEQALTAPTDQARVLACHRLGDAVKD